MPSKFPRESEPGNKDLEYSRKLHSQEGILELFPFQRSDHLKTHFLVIGTQKIKVSHEAVRTLFALK